jgi:cytochrome c oxidase subunit III
MTTGYRPPEHPRREPSFEGTTTAELGLNIALGSFGVLFLATLLGFIITRVEAPDWKPAGSPGLPQGLWLSTLWLVMLSGSLHKAERLLRDNAVDSFRFWLQLSLGLSCLFLITQAANWTSIFWGASSPAQVRNLYVYSVVFMTGLHALHVVGGVVPLGVILARSGRLNYSSSRSESVHLVRRYWDFLLVVWIVLLAALVLF